MALRHVKSHLCNGCGRSMEQDFEIWTIGGKPYCSRRCFDADGFKEASRKSSRAYIGLAFIIALLMLAFATTPKVPLRRGPPVRMKPDRRDCRVTWTR